MLLRFSVLACLVFTTAHAATDHTLPLSSANVHWGFFSKTVDPVLTMASGETVTVEMATHHACDDWDRMIEGDEGMMDIFGWDSEGKKEEFRGATGGGDGVHVLTGPIFVEEAEPGDILKVEIMDLYPRFNPDGKTYGSNAAAWWGFQARVPNADGTPFAAGSFTGTPDKSNEVVTIYEIMDNLAVPVYQFGWPVITDPQGEERDYIAYPGTCVPHDEHGMTVPSSVVTDMGWMKKDSIVYNDEVFRAAVPINYHIGCMGLAPESHDFVDSIPPMPTGGNLDNKRIGVGTTMYYPVEVAGAMLSMGDAHAAQGDSELDGTGIETSITGEFKITVIKQSDFTPAQEVLDFPLGETEDIWFVHGFTETDYLDTYADNPGDIYGASSIDKAMQNAYMQTRKFVMAEYGLTEYEATTIITNGVDFGMTQLVDGNWGVHSIIPKSVFVEVTEEEGNIAAEAKSASTGLGEADLKISPETVHWGFFSKTIDPVLTVTSGSEVVVDMATHHACDDWDKMIKGDADMESIYLWSDETTGEEFRGATGGGDGVHVLTGPIFVEDAMPGDILKVEVLGLVPRPNPEGKTYGSNAAAWWGYQARVPKVDGTDFTAGDFTNTPGMNDESITIYEVLDNGDGTGVAVPSYQFEWPVIVDPQGVERNFIAYPGTCVPHDEHGMTTPSGDVAGMGWTKSESITYYDDVFRARIPINYHVGCMGLAPESHDFVDSIPPMPTGGNLDNKRIGVGTTMYYPVEVEGALLSMGDAHAAQGDSELGGTGIETSITGKFKLTVIKKEDFTPAQEVLDFPLGETDTMWMVHGFTKTDYLETFADNPADIYGASNIDETMKNAFTQTRKFIMAEYGLTADEATTIITQGVDFGMTQLVDGNWGVHGLVPKSLFNAVAVEDVGGDDTDSSAFSILGYSLAFVFSAWFL